MQNHRNRGYYPLSIILFSVITLCTACTDSDEMLTDIDNIIPMSCTIPGKLEFNSDTKDILSRYQQE